MSSLLCCCGSLFFFLCHALKVQLLVVMLLFTPVSVPTFLTGETFAIVYVKSMLVAGPVPTNDLSVAPCFSTVHATVRVWVPV